MLLISSADRHVSMMADIISFDFRFSNFGHNSDSTLEFYDILKHELLHRDTDEFEKHIVHIAMAISSFIHVGVYPLSLVELLFSEEWLKKAGGLWNF